MKIDSIGKIMDISSNCYKILGYKNNELIGANINDYIIKGNIEFTLEKEKNFELSIKSKNGTAICFDAVLSTLYKDDQEIIGANLSLIDISKYKVIEENEKRFRSLLNHSKDIVYMHQLQPERKCLYINDTVEELLGKTSEEIYKYPNIPFEIVHPDDYEIHVKKADGTADYSKPIQSRMKDKSGKYVWFEDNLYPVYNSEGKLIAIEGFCRNIQDRKELEEQLKELSCYDSLTRLFSSNYYKKHEKRLNEVKNSSIGIIMCDLDNLKVTNDSFGHAYGDRLLINFGNLLKRKFIKNAVIARLGGDEFIVLFENISECGVKRNCLELQQTVEEFNICNQDMPIQVSIGWAYSPTSLHAMKNIFNIADYMMYEDKLNKRKNDN